ncbi:MAG: DNA-protecting protein DprA [Acidobacteria bacterium]|nr:DNA-protecting protein DprA [Acidobacteriota bacterium]MBI3656218.1 DNA-protecting protein DprA [Acidobacteriota bacterium]
MRNNHDQLLPWVILTLTPGLGVRTFKKLLERFGVPDSALMADRHELVELGVTTESLRQMQSLETLKKAEAELRRAGDEGVHVLSLADEAYPSLLKEIYDAPPVLYIKGSLQVFRDRPSIAIVGTRTPTPYGIHVAEKLSADLALAGITIVSGLARGIDTAAHRGALSVAGLTAAVLGSGVDIIYPKENKRMAGKIAESGAIVSEFPFATYPAPQNFPIRNRIISGLAHGSVIVEAAERSGSLITARLALEQNREVFAVPGPITGPKSFGPNCLLKQGAKLVQDWRDIVEELIPPLREQIFGSIRPVASLAKELPLMTEEENLVFSHLTIEQPTHIDQLATGTRLSPPILNERLLTLEMKGLVKQLPGKNFVRK